MLAVMEKSQTLQKVHLVVCGGVNMSFYPLVTRVSMTICVVWCQCIFGVFFLHFFDFFWIFWVNWTIERSPVLKKKFKQNSGASCSRTLHSSNGTTLYHMIPVTSVNQDYLQSVIQFELDRTEICSRRRGLMFSGDWKMFLDSARWCFVNLATIQKLFFFSKKYMKVYLILRTQCLKGTFVRCLQ